MGTGEGFWLLCILACVVFRSKYPPELAAAPRFFFFLQRKPPIGKKYSQRTHSDEVGFVYWFARDYLLQYSNTG